jgi:hypothetical protein
MLSVIVWSPKKCACSSLLFLFSFSLVSHASHSSLVRFGFEHGSDRSVPRVERHVPPRLVNLQFGQ